MPAQVGGAGTFRCDHDHDRSEIELQWYRNRRILVAREGRPELDLSESMVTAPGAPRYCGRDDVDF